MRLLLSLMIFLGVGQKIWADTNLAKVEKLTSALSENIKSKSLYLSLLNSSKSLVLANCLRGLDWAWRCVGASPSTMEPGFI